MESSFSGENTAYFFNFLRHAYYVTPQSRYLYTAFFGDALPLERLNRHQYRRRISENVNVLLDEFYFLLYNVEIIMTGRYNDDLSKM